MPAAEPTYVVEKVVWTPLAALGVIEQWIVLHPCPPPHYNPPPRFGLRPA